MGTVGEHSASRYDPLVGPSRSADGGSEATRCQTLDAVVPTDRENLVGNGTKTFRRSSSGIHRVNFLTFGVSKCMFSCSDGQGEFGGERDHTFRQAQVGDIE